MNPNRQSLRCNWASPVAFPLEPRTRPAPPDHDDVPQIQHIIHLECISDPRLPNTASAERPGCETACRGTNRPASASPGGFAISRPRQGRKRLRLTPDFVRPDSITNVDEKVIENEEKAHPPGGNVVENLPAWAIAAPVAGGAVERVEKCVSSPRPQKTNPCNRPRQSWKRGLNILAACWETWQRK